MAEPAIAVEAPNASASKTPFWRQLPLFFVRPLHWKPLGCTLLFALATLAGFLIPLPAPYAHAVAHASAWLAFVRYAYPSFEATAQVTPASGAPAAHAAGARAALPYKQWAMFGLSASFLALAKESDAIAFGLALAFLIVSLPASVVALALTRSFWRSLYPLGAFAMLRRVGLPYAGICACLLALLAGGVFLQGLLRDGIEAGAAAWPAAFAESLAKLLANLLAMYSTLVMFGLIGYLVDQYRSALGWTLGAAPRSSSLPSPRPPASSALPSHSIARASERLAADSGLEKALALAHDAQRKAPDDVAAQAAYHTLLRLAGRKHRLLAHARRYLTLLLQRAQGDEAYALYCEMRERDSRFQPDQPGQLLRLAEVARRRSDYAQALALIKGFDRRFPNHPEIPAVYLFAARVLGENLNRVADAHEIIGVFLRRYPEHRLGGEARQLAQALAKAGGAAAVDEAAAPQV